MPEFDIPIHKARQVWHQVTYVRSPERPMVFVQTSGGRVPPRYEKGAKAIIDSLPGPYKCTGNYFWSGYIDGDDIARLRVADMLDKYLSEQVKRQQRKQLWKAQTMKLTECAIERVRWENPVWGSAEGKPPHSDEELQDRIGGAKGNFDRDHKEKWNFLRDSLTGWANMAEQPLYDWIRNIKEVA
ncbi:MAG: hypothetical protein COB36_10995 [Alphaproteobacteria bacterium]|nr:MAG: hypothetical protein COB36_10995 [Alphaproteobacteria bacterium]